MEGGGGIQKVVFYRVYSAENCVLCLQAAAAEVGKQKAHFFSPHIVLLQLAQQKKHLAAQPRLFLRLRICQTFASCQTAQLVCNA